MQFSCLGCSSDFPFVRALQWRLSFEPVAHKAISDSLTFLREECATIAAAGVPPVLRCSIGRLGTDIGAMAERMHELSGRFFNFALPARRPSADRFWPAVPGASSRRSLRFDPRG